MPVASADEHDADVIQVLGINDFHGRIQSNGAEAGAAVLAGAVNELRGDYANTVFSAAGDLIGASTFESFIAHDKPTIDALNEAGLEVSAVGNHEFDQGYDDLIDRVMAPYHADDNPFGGAEWEYIGANVRFKDTGDPAVPESWIQDFGAYQVGFVGAVTEHLDELVSPGGIEDIEVTDIVESANRVADELRTEDGADLVVLLVHEGAPTTALSSATAPGTDFGDIVNGVSADIDAIISGHTHLSYNHAIPVQEWIDESRAVTTRPVVSAGQYGYNLNQLLFTMDPDTDEVVGIEQNVLPLAGNYTADPAVAAIVAAAVAEAEVLGAEVIGEIEGPFNRAKLSNGTTENRGGESTLGNLVAEVQQEQTSAENTGSAEIAFMNPGGLRADMVGNPGGYPAELTYKQAATVQPFANTLVNMTLTGAQVKTALEQQWQPTGSSRPFLKLGISEGLTYTYDPAGPAGDRVTQISLHGDPIDPAADYSVTVNSFLSTGGDNFGVFAQGTNSRDTGKSDLQAMVDYLAAQEDAIGPDYTQRAVGVSFPAGAPASYSPGEGVTFDLSSLSFSTAADTKDANVDVSLDGESLGSFPVDNTVTDAVFDETGKAAVEVTLPADTPTGVAVLTVTGDATGTTVEIPVVVKDTATVTASVTPGSVVAGTGTSTVDIDVESAGETPTGDVDVLVDGVSAGTATLDDEGSASVTIGPFDAAGSKSVVVEYAGDDVTEAAASEAGTLTVTKAASKTKVKKKPKKAKVNKTRVKLKIEVKAAGLTPSGKVKVKVAGKTRRGTLNAKGRVTIKLPAFKTTGKKKAKVVYLGDKTVKKSKKTVTIKVRR